MEAKKNPAKDIHRKSGMFFQLGLGISIALVITAFEWRTEVIKVKPRIVDNHETSIVLIPITEQKIKEPPLPSPVKNDRKDIKGFTPVSDIPAIEIGTDDPEIGIDPEKIPSTPIVIESQTPEICEECTFYVPETPVTPVGGLPGFYSIIRKNLKYPKGARNMGVEGKVTVEFVVNREGIPVDFKVISGIGAGCDEEAMRVIGLTKWNPGKQRGKPVRVKMVIPIIFHLN